MTPREVVRQRRADREALLDRAREYVKQLDPELELLAAVVVGSVARGDFHVASDIDVVLVADGLPDNAAERWERVASRQGVIQPIAWTPQEWRTQQARRNPLTLDALDHGVWLLGRPDLLD